MITQCTQCTRHARNSPDGPGLHGASHAAHHMQVSWACWGAVSLWRRIVLPRPWMQWWVVCPNKRPPHTSHHTA